MSYESRDLVHWARSSSDEDLIKTLEYKGPEFSKAQQLILEKFFSNTDKPICSVRHMGVVSGALGSMHSRQSGDIRSIMMRLIEKEPQIAEGFMSMQIPDLVNKFGYDFFERVYGEYGDDSIAQVVPFNVMGEDVTMYAAMQWLHGRLLAGIEKSSRYRRYDKKVDGEYQYFVDPLITKAGLEDEFRGAVDGLFEVYSSLVRAKSGTGRHVVEYIRKELPLDKFRAHVNEAVEQRGWETATDEEIQEAYDKTVRAMHLDNVRHLLPLATKTVLGLQMNLQNVRDMVVRGYSTPTTESVVLAEMVRREAEAQAGPLVASVDPQGEYSNRAEAFIRFRAGTKKVGRDLTVISHDLEPKSEWAELGYKGRTFPNHVQVSHDKTGFAVELATNDSIDDIVAGIIRETHPQATVSSARCHVENMSDEEKEELVLRYAGLPSLRTNRRHKPGRAFENLNFDISIYSTIGEIRDLRRHRMMYVADTESFDPHGGFFIAPMLHEVGLADYVGAVYERAAEVWGMLNDQINPYVASLVLPFATRAQFNIGANARQLHHMCELRTQPGAHLNYKIASQMMLLGAAALFPQIQKTMKFIDMETEIDFGRALQEIRTKRKS